MADEPEYLQRLRRAQEERGKKEGTGQGGAKATGPQSLQEQETVRWAKQLAAGAELRSIRNLAGARFAVLVRLQSASGVKFLSVDGLPSRAALIERVKPGATVGEELVGAYEVRGGRPVTVSFDLTGQVLLKMGPPRPGANPVDPERMIRKAAAIAAEQAKLKPKGGGPGGKNRGR
ncbi:MAG: hypothetical protein ABI647_15795 [Gemmatimonadota bacterium]